MRGTKKSKKNFIYSLTTFLIAFPYFLSCCRAQTHSIILGRPTDTTITASILADYAMQYYIVYGKQPGIYPNATTEISHIANSPDEIDLKGLHPNTRYYYRMKYKQSGEVNYHETPEYTFHTQRAKGSTFTFTLESDEHLYDKKGVKSLYQICLNNQANDKPDFMLSLGDIFGDDRNPNAIFSADMDLLHKNYRPFLGSICHSIPFYVCLGNHEGESEYYLLKNPPENLAVWGTKWRKFYYPNPYPNNFYSGNNHLENYGIGYPENYYAWTWGDALFVVLDVYREQCDSLHIPQKWDWTLGKTQYDWLKTTLENSTSKYKFVFAHHIRGYGRGGIREARLYEWGGYDGKNGNTYSFNAQRPGWDKPIHQLFRDTKVNIFFQGHDHVFAHETLDGITYQALPMPSDSTYTIGKLANADAYVSDTLFGSGHLRVTVADSCVKVDFVRAWLPADTLSGIHKNKEVAFSYTIGKCASALSINEHKNENLIQAFPNPADKILYLKIPDSNSQNKFLLRNLTGQIILETNQTSIETTSLHAGIYFLTLQIGNEIQTKKILITHP